jgi:hypothetical protein
MNTTYPEVESSIGTPPDADCAMPDSASSGSATARAKEAAGSALRKGEEAAAYVGHKAEEAASYVGQRAEDATSSLGGSLKSLGETVRDKAPQSGMAGSVAHSLECTGEYLQTEGLSGIGEDLSAVIRRNPIPALLAAVGVGFLIAQATTSRRS